MLKLFCIFLIYILFTVNATSKNFFDNKHTSNDIELSSSKKMQGITDSTFRNIQLHIDNDDIECLKELQKIKYCRKLEIIVYKRDFHLNHIIENVNIKQLKVLFIRSCFPLLLPNLSKFICDELTLNAPNYIQDANSTLPKKYSQLKVGYTYNTILPMVLNTKKIQFECLSDFYFSSKDSLGIPEISEGFFDFKSTESIDTDTNEYSEFFDSFLQSNNWEKIEFLGISMSDVNCEHINVDTLIFNTFKVSTLTLSNVQSKHLKFIRNLSYFCKIVLKKPNDSISSVWLSSFNLLDIPVDISMFPNLRELTIDNCTFSNLNIDLKKIKNLKKLNIYSLNIPQKQYDILLKDALKLNIKLDIRQNAKIFPN